MVTLNLDASDVGSITNDFYVGVRVGDAQKFSKVAAARSFKFPDKAVEGRRYGKVELFKRVGSCSVSLDKGLEKSIQEICFSGAGDMKFKVGLGKGVEPTASPASQKGELAEDAKAKAAKEYLQAHHLELRLAEAMRCVLRERPDDPAAFIAQRLTANENMVSITPKPDGSTSKPLSPEAAATAAFQQKPSVGSWCVPRKDASGAGVPGFAKVEVAQLMPPEAKQAAKACFAKLPSVGTWCLSLPRPQQAEPAAEDFEATKDHAKDEPPQAKGSRFAMGPSVGTWLTPLDPAAATAGPAPPQYLSHLSPSVGTWLIPRPAVEEAPPLKTFGVATTTLFGSGFHSFGMRPGFRFI